MPSGKKGSRDKGKSNICAKSAFSRQRLIYPTNSSEWIIYHSVRDRHGGKCTPDEIAMINKKIKSYRSRSMFRE